MKNPTSLTPAPSLPLEGRPYVLVTPLMSVTRRVEGFTFTHERYRSLSMDYHTHGEWQVCVPLSGRAHIKVNDDDYLLGPECAVVIPPRVRHANNFLDGEYEYLSVLLPDGWLEASVRDFGLPAPSGTFVIVEPFLWPLVRQMASELIQPGLGTEPLLLAGLEQLRILLARTLAHAQPTLVGMDMRVLRAIDRMARSYDCELTVEALAAEANMTPRHFERCFKEAVGLTPKRYLIDVRLAMARQYLETTAMPIAEIAAHTGFHDASHLIATFRRTIGVTPAAYRRGEH